jgi:Protein of unknown function (DUF3225)
VAAALITGCPTGPESEAIQRKQRPSVSDRPTAVQEAMEINIPEVVAEVRAAFMRYERALNIYDVDTLDSLFWNDALTLRYGPNGTLLGHTAISSFRRARNIKGIERTLQKTYITTFGRDFAVSNTESDVPGNKVNGRQSQTWVRMPEGWRIVSAHVSDLPITT